MPELPEVEIVARELREAVIDKEIQRIEALWGKSYVNQSKRKIAGQRIAAVNRRGKYLLLHLTHSVLVIHLRMTGQLLVQSTPEKPDNHARLRLFFSDGSALCFRDTRKFGRFYHTDDPAFILKGVGVDALDESFTLPVFREMLQPSAMKIKAFLLSQQYVAGLGNIYADESLFCAGVHPLSVTSAIKAPVAGKLYQAILTILQAAIANMGSTISDYRDAYGNSGQNQNYFNVYGREDEPCKKCRTPIQKIRAAGRGTHLCPKCQIIY